MLCILILVVHVISVPEPEAAESRINGISPRGHFASHVEVARELFVCNGQYCLVTLTLYTRYTT